MFGIDDAILGSVGGALVSGLGSFMGTQQQNAQSVSNMYNQAALNNVTMNQQAQINSNLMNQQGGINQSFLNQQIDANAQTATTAFQRSQQQLHETQDYNTSMANTAFQRQVKDLRAAGLNPILGMGTSGAPAPTSSAPSPAAPSAGLASVGGSSVGGQGVNTPSMQSALGNGISSALQGSKLFSGLQQAAAEAKNSQDTNNVIRATANLKNAETATAEIEAKKREQYLDAAIGAQRAQAGASSAQGVASLANAAKTDQDRANNTGGGTYEMSGSAGVPGLGGGTFRVQGPYSNVKSMWDLISSNINPNSKSPYGSLPSPSLFPGP
jgi:hypothetical protein